MTRKRAFVTAAISAISTLALAQAGGGAGGASGGAAGAGAREGPSAISVGSGGTVTRSGDLSPGGTRREVPFQGGATGSAMDNDDRLPQVGGPPVDVRPPQQQVTGTQTPTTRPIVPESLGPIGVHPAPAAGGTVTGRIDTSPGAGGVTSSSAGTAGSTAGGPAMTPAGGGAPVVAAPSGFLQGNQQPNATGGGAVRGGFGSTDASATAGTATTPGVASSEIDVTQRTQQLSQQAAAAQPAGGTLAPATQPAREQPLQQQQQPGVRPNIPMPPAQGSNQGGAAPMNPTPAR